MISFQFGRYSFLYFFHLFLLRPNGKEIIVGRKIHGKIAANNEEKRRKQKTAAYFSYFSVQLMGRHVFLILFSLSFYGRGGPVRAQFFLLSRAVWIGLTDRSPNAMQRIGKKNKIKSALLFGGLICYGLMAARPICLTPHDEYFLPI